MKEKQFGFIESYKQPARRFGKVRGVGINDFPYSTKLNWHNVWQYALWSNVIARSYCKKLKERFAHYRETTCCDDWLVMSNFISDIVEIDNFEKFRTENWQIDKDILFKGNNIYRKDRVCFVPHEINSLLTSSKRARGSYPVGVSFNKRVGKFTAKLSINSKRKYLGFFDDELSAFNAYKVEKELNVKNMANKYKEELSPNVYEALIGYEVNIDD